MNFSLNTFVISLLIHLNLLISKWDNERWKTIATFFSSHHTAKRCSFSPPCTFIKINARPRITRNSCKFPELDFPFYSSAQSVTYDDWFNQRVCEKIRAQSDSRPESLSIIVCNWHAFNFGIIICNRALYNDIV